MEKRTALFVDDEEKMLSSLKRCFIDEPYETLFANSGKEALEILKQQEVHVIVIDMLMPGMSGLELLKIVKKEYPHTIRMVLSGYAQIQTLLDAVNEGEIFRYLVKPWKFNEELKTVVRQAIEYYDLHCEREKLMSFCELWIEGNELDANNLQFLRELLSSRKQRLYEWREKCDSIPLSNKALD